MMHPYIYLNLIRKPVIKKRCSGHEPGQERAARAIVQCNKPTTEKAANAALRVACGGLFLAAAQRSTFAVILPAVQSSLNLSLQSVGLLQSVFLVGYLIGQVPSGLLADAHGGPFIMAMGLCVWSIATFLHGLTPLCVFPLLALYLTRGLQGLGQSVIMPAVSSTAVQWFPSEQRSQRTSLAYASFSAGTVGSLALTPLLLMNGSNWCNAFYIQGIIGIAVAIWYLYIIPRQRSGLATNEVNSVDYTLLDRKQLLMLCWTHGVIGFSFFVLQSWIPIYIYSLERFELGTVGLLSALPWLAAAAVSVVAGMTFDWLQSRNILSTKSVRRLSQSVACTLGSFAFVPFFLNEGALPVPVVITCLIVAVAGQGFNYSGFHSYVQDVSAQHAGLVLGITNSCSIWGGIGGNLVAGSLAASHGYAMVFGLAALLQVISLCTWLVFAEGSPITITTSNK